MVVAQPQLRPMVSCSLLALRSLLSLVKVLLYSRVAWAVAAVSTPLKAALVEALWIEFVLLVEPSPFLSWLVSRLV